MNHYRYIELDLDGTCYIRADSVDSIERVDGIIFDCDGVLIDASDSYDKTIQITVNYILSQLLGIELPEDFVPMNLIYQLRMSGGFNNDWDTSYIILLYIFSQLPKDFQSTFTDIYRRLPNELCKKAKERLMEVSSSLKSTNVMKDVQLNIEKLQKGLFNLARMADSSGISSLEGFLNGESLTTFKEFLKYPGKIGESLVTTFFEEAYLGSEIFERVYKIEPQFRLGLGMIENERLMVKEETLQELLNLLGEGKLGIASGRGYYATQKTLGKLMSYFNLEAMVFSADDLLKEGLTKDELMELVKPAPYPLLKAADGLLGASKVMYVGNSTEDLLMEERANKVVNRFLFAGIYISRYGCEAQDQLRLFLDRGADVVLQSVNQLPKVLRRFR
ncbi:MAG: hypothetical protein NZ896_05240 [Nitrososphaerales archaeon]|nr:hypothetical protein [Nitrososphaerales archaeon]